ncbi:ribonuclease HII [Spirochaetia bacterium 38H-sp]|uniref:Ribonuclease n=1 Tax=Rarispira pelagica TaxID=3141764 RepID=A0ABU9UE28_9SPIR
MDMEICGIDEAGRGPLAGPVTAASVILPKGFVHPLLRDSKKLSASQRKKMYSVIKDSAIAVGTGWVWPDEIDRINIHRASLLAMQRAYKNMCHKAGLCEKEIMVLVDGKWIPEGIDNCTAVIKGDSLHPPIMAASIVAKYLRDIWMEGYSLLCPNYGFEKHKGYPTQSHREAIVRYGRSPIHRHSFAGPASPSP